MLFTVEKTITPQKLNRFGGTCLGDTYGATQQYLIKNGKPYICRMGGGRTSPPRKRKPHPQNSPPHREG